MDLYELNKIDFVKKQEILFDLLREDDDFSIDFLKENSDIEVDTIENMSDGDFEFHVKDNVEYLSHDELNDYILKLS